MTARKSQTNAASKRSAWLQIVFWLTAIEAVVAIVMVFMAPSEGANAFLLGLSLTRWVLVVALVVLAGIFGGLAWNVGQSGPLSKTVVGAIDNALKQPKLYFICIALALLVTVVGFYLILLSFKFTDALIQARFVRLLPLIAWMFVFSVQSLIVLPRLRNSDEIDVFAREAWRPILAALSILLVMGTFMFLSGVGLQPDRTGWDNPGVPLMATQVVSAWLGAVLLYGALRFAESRWGKVVKLDLIIVVALWALAAWVWIAQPLTPTFFSPSPRAPNYEYYPYSDATTHDLATQNLLIGDGFTEFIEKPLYSFFLVVLHVFAGQDYQAVVTAQIVVLALFPGVLYLVASLLHHRLTGGFLALAVILREANSIALSGEVGVSHSKLLMTDLPTALAISAFGLLVLRWLQADRRDLRWLIWIGGVMGLMMLLRSQTIIFLPFLMLVAFFRGNPVWKTRVLHAGILLMSFALAAVPWMVRNSQNTGQFGYSQPLQALYLAKQYSLTPELADPGFPEGTRTAQFVSLGISRVVQFTMAHPGEVARFITAHFFHNVTSSFLTLPMRFDLADKIVTFYNLQPYWVGLEGRLWSECCSLNAYIEGTPYWDRWDGNLPTEAWLPLLANATFVAVGGAAIWGKSRWLALVPIGTFILYNFSTAIARVSGWRLILPVDWVLLLLYCAGLTQVTLWVWRYLFGAGTTNTNSRAAKKQSVWQKQRLPVWAAFFLGAGLLLPVAELLVPAQYPEITAAEAEAIWQRSELADATGLDLGTFLAQPGADLRWGRALYPRFYAAGTGEPGEDISAYHSLPFSRMAFWVIGEVDDQIALPLANSSAFPNASEVLVLGCVEQGYFRAAAVVFAQDEAPDLLADTAAPFTCLE